MSVHLRLLTLTLCSAAGTVGVVNLDQLNQPRMADGDTWLTAEAARQRLGVARQTLYAYVSRGLLRAHAANDDPRRSLYHRRDVDALIERRRRSRSAVAASTIDFGEPVLASRITRIAEGRLFYRGRDATDLAETATLEDVAALLWEAPVFPAAPRSDYRPDRDASAMARCLRAVAWRIGPGIWARGAQALLADAAGLLRLVAQAACGGPGGHPIHQMLARAWGVGPGGADLLRRALVLCADHELNASTFAVRVVASTGASLSACVLAGLAALSGPLHGGATDQVRAFLAEPGLRRDPAKHIAARLARGERLPGIGHRLYPDGDPRATALLVALGPGKHWQAVLPAAEDLTGRRPNLDTALVMLELRLRLPRGAALGVFAAGRTAGWIAHALEQRQSGRLIRPRARYDGPVIPAEPALPEPN